MNTANVRGFTLVELIVVVALLAIVASIALPNFTQFIRNNQLQSKSDEVVAFLQYARSRAIVNRQAYEVDVSNATQWKLIDNNNEVERLLDFNIAQAKPSVAALTDQKLIYTANGMVQEAFSMTLCRDDDFSNGYFIEVKSAGTVHFYRRGMKSDSVKMNTCTL